MNTGEWTFNNHDDGMWGHEHFATREEAIKAGLEYAKNEEWTKLFVGQVQEIPVESPMDADVVIERTAEMIDDNYGGEFEPGESFINNLVCGDTERLQELLDEAFFKWVEERDISCPAFTIENCEQIQLPPVSEVKP